MSGSITTHGETERTYDADPVALLDLLGPLGLHAAPPRSEQLAAVYLDTEDLRLLRAGITLRRRTGGPDAGWHLKLPAGRDHREEIGHPLTPEHTAPPAQLAALTRLPARGGEIAPVAEIATERRQWELTDGAGQAVAHLVGDQVTAQTMGESTTAESWREVEVELTGSGTVALLDRIEAELGQAGVHRAAAKSKLARLFAAELPASHPAPGRTGSAGAAVMDYLRTQAERLRTGDVLVRRDVPNGVHQLRLATRRMRSALQAYGRVLDPAETRDLVRELRWLGRQLDEARDTEVIEARLTEKLNELPAELVLGPVDAQLTRSLQRRRRDARDEVLAALGGRRYLRLHDAIDRLLAEPPLTRRAKRPASAELARSVNRAWRRTERRMLAADRTHGRVNRDRALHETRKAAKRLRYAVEVAVPAGGRSANRFRKRLKEMHRVLGEHQDSVVCRPVIRELGARAHSERGNGFTFGLLYGLESAHADRIDVALPPVWERLSRKKSIRWFSRR